MRILIDTHTLIWATDDDSKLSPTASGIMATMSNELLLSAASIWEISIKVSLGKLTISQPFRSWIDTAVAHFRLQILPITVEYAERQMTLPWHHRDPFDRMIIAQTFVEGVDILSIDTIFDSYGVNRVW